MRNLRLALGLLTTIPVNLPTDLSAGDSGRAAVWYPLVGLVIGALTWLSWTAAMAVFPPLVGAALALAVWVVLTGGLHLDGLADCCDGLLVSAAKKRRLEIMKDPHIGTFGVIGLVLVLFVKAATLASLQPVSSLGILLAGSLARWCILPAGLLPLARDSGMGADFVLGFRRPDIAWGMVIPFAVAFFLGTPGIFAAVAGLSAMALLLWLANSRIGGVTGDVFGMIVEIVEAVVLISLAVRI